MEQVVSDSREWRTSGIIQHLQLSPLEPGHLVYSNEADALYILLNIKCQSNIVTIIQESSDAPHKKINTFSEWDKEGYDYFVYFDKTNQGSYPYTKEQLLNNVNVFKIIQVSDGAIFAVKRNP